MALASTIRGLFGTHNIANGFVTMVPRSGFYAEKMFIQPMDSID